MQWFSTKSPPNQSVRRHRRRPALIGTRVAPPAPARSAPSPIATMTFHSLPRRRPRRGTSQSLRRQPTRGPSPRPASSLGSAQPQVLRQAPLALFFLQEKHLCCCRGRRRPPPPCPPLGGGRRRGGGGETETRRLDGAIRGQKSIVAEAYCLSLPEIGTRE
jgi:hypothetical protein